MGHTRLGTIPKTQRWNGILALLADTDEDSSPQDVAANVEEIVAETLKATQDYLQRAINDIGLRYTFYLLTRVALASRHENWEEEVGAYAITLEHDTSLLEFTAEFQDAIDEYLLRNRHSSDIAEMAQQAAGETLVELVAPKAITLFGSGSEELRWAIRELSSKNGYSQLGQRFFGAFLARYINFYVSRLSAACAGSAQISQIGDLTRFNEALHLHCIQSARIVHDFCGEWYSKTNYKEGITLENTSRFLAVALRKLQAELRIQEADL
jgi:hypothetical protein